LAIATSSGASWIYRRTDGGVTWTAAVSYDDGGLGWGDFGFTDATHGLVIHGPRADLQLNGAAASALGPHAATLFLTGDAGATWYPVSITGGSG
jgi:hypothetical protein